MPDPVHPLQAGDLYARAGVVGQERAVALLRAAVQSPVHAYLFDGPVGRGTRAASKAFAASLLCHQGGCGECRDCRLALAEHHPDGVVVEREGASISRDQISGVIEEANRAPVEGARKVVVLVDLHLVEQQYPRLLKTLEAPPASVVFVVLVDQVLPDLATIASRCVIVPFGPVAPGAIAAALVHDGVSSDEATAVADAAGGSMERARLLAADPGFASRLEAWRSVPGRLDGAGATVAALADALVASVDAVVTPLAVQQAVETKELEADLERYKPRDAIGRKRRLEERHRREQRRVRADELKAGLATLAGAYRDRLVAGGPPAAGGISAIEAIDSAGLNLIRNPNEVLLLQGLLARLTDVAEGSR